MQVLLQFYPSLSACLNLHFQYSLRNACRKGEQQCFINRTSSSFRAAKIISFIIKNLFIIYKCSVFRCRHAMSSSDGSSDIPGSVFVSYKFQAQVLIHTISLIQAVHLTFD